MTYKYTAHNETVAQLKGNNHLSLTCCIISTLPGTCRMVTSNPPAHKFVFNQRNCLHSFEQNVFKVIVTDRAVHRTQPCCCPRTTYQASCVRA